MRKKILILIFVLSHFLCILFGYCIASSQMRCLGSAGETQSEPQEKNIRTKEHDITTTEAVTETMATTEETNTVQFEIIERTEDTIPSQTTVPEPTTVDPPVTEAPVEIPEQGQNEGYKTPEEEV